MSWHLGDRAVGSAFPQAERILGAGRGCIIFEAEAAIPWNGPASLGQAGSSYWVSSSYPYGISSFRSNRQRCN